MRNGETSKVIENLNIEQPKMEKEDIEEYLRFKALKNSQLQFSAGLQGLSGVGDSNISLAPRDRKLSQEYFKEEAKRLDRKLQEQKQQRNKKQQQTQSISEAHTEEQMDVMRSQEEG